MSENACSAIETVCCLTSLCEVSVTAGSEDWADYPLVESLGGE